MFLLGPTAKHVFEYGKKLNYFFPTHNELSDYYSLFEQVKNVWQHEFKISCKLWMSMHGNFPVAWYKPLQPRAASVK